MVVPPRLEATALEDRFFEEVCDVVRNSGVQTLPAPQKFSADYSQHLQEKERAQEEYKRAQAELPEIEESLKSIKDALEATGFRTG